MYYIFVILGAIRIIWHTFELNWSMFNFRPPYTLWVWRPFVFLRFYKNPQGFSSGTHWIWNQHIQIDQKQQNNFIYIIKQGPVAWSSDYNKVFDRSSRNNCFTSAEKWGRYLSFSWRHCLIQFCCLRSIDHRSSSLCNCIVFWFLSNQKGRYIDVLQAPLFVRHCDIGQHRARIYFINPPTTPIEELMVILFWENSMKKKKLSSGN